MAFKKPAANVPVPDSPDRLFNDLPRRKHPSLYDHQGQVLRTYASEALDASDVALELPTGSGKTLVGLLLGEWRRRKFKERVLYLCPTKQLVKQVAEEASEKYGISVEPFTGSARDYSPASKAAYQDGRKIAVTTYNSLFNSNPFFDNPDVILVDDSHSSENYIASQWTVHIKAQDEPILFNAIASVVNGCVTSSCFAKLLGEEDSLNGASWVDKIPTPKMVEIAGELRQVVSENIANSENRYSWLMISDHLEACHLYLSRLEIVIRPLIPPTWTHSPFSSAKQRIFMSATLGDGGDLERLTGRLNIKRLPVPDGWDRQGIGRRFFIFPERSLREDEVIQLRRDLMKSVGRSLVLTPNNKLSDLIGSDVKDCLGFPVFNASDLENSRSVFVEKDAAVAIIANRFDGIDFPNDDCRLLFVEGLPKATNLQERFLMTRMGANLLFNERIQTRVIQAIGRCTRGMNDYSAVVVTGDDLPAYLTDQHRRKYFHPELQAELDFGVEQSMDVDIQTINDNFSIFLKHDTDWEDANEAILEVRATANQEGFPAMGELAEIVSHEIKWQQSMWNADYAIAYEFAREILGKLVHPSLRGYRALWYYLAGSSAELSTKNNLVDLQDQAALQFKSAKRAASGIPWLVSLAHRLIAQDSVEEMKDALNLQQIEALENYIYSLGLSNNRKFAQRERDIREGLRSEKGFEQAQKMLGEHLGFSAGKVEADASPDPWWQLGDTVFVFEDHANANPETACIDATKARQAASHPNWIREHVAGAELARVHSILVTPAIKAKSGAMPHLSDVAYWELDDFRKWSETVLVKIRELRSAFREQGDLDWRSKALEELRSIKADASSMLMWFSENKARNLLQEVP